MNKDGKTLGRVTEIDFDPVGATDSDIRVTFAVSKDTRWAATNYVISEIDVGAAVKRQEAVGTLKELMRNPRYWRERDPVIIKQVREGFDAMFPAPELDEL